MAWNRESEIHLKWRGGRLIDLNGRASDLLSFYRRHVQRHEFGGVKGVRLRCDVFSVPDARGALIVCHGAGESSVRYSELVYDLLVNDVGYELFLINFRGQGYSQRVTGTVREWSPEWRPDGENREVIDYRKTHVERFDHYADDLHRLISRVIAPLGHRNLYALGHSMGGGILTRHLERHPGTLSAAVLSAPMLCVNWPVRPSWITSALFKTMSKFRGRSYAWGERAFRFFDEPFEGNPYTRSRSRFMLRQYLLQENPETVLGGKTWGWAHQVHSALKQVRADAGRIETPVLLFTAGDDVKVAPWAHRRVAQRITRGTAPPRCRHVILAKARHELLQEKDEIRDRVLNETIGFLLENEI